MWSRISHTGDTFPGVSCGLFCGSCYRKDARMAAKCPNPAGNSNCRGQATVLSSLQLTSSAQDTVLVTVAQLTGAFQTHNSPQSHWLYR